LPETPEEFYTRAKDALRMPRALQPPATDEKQRAGTKAVAAAPRE
jgi:hypothetical protein